MPDEDCLTLHRLQFSAPAMPRCGMFGQQPPQLRVSAVDVVSAAGKLITS